MKKLSAKTLIINILILTALYYSSNNIYAQAVSGTTLIEPTNAKVCSNTYDTATFSCGVSVSGVTGASYTFGWQAYDSSKWIPLTNNGKNIIITTNTKTNSSQLQLVPPPLTPWEKSALSLLASTPQYRCIVTPSVGSTITSDAVDLIINGGPIIERQPISKDICSGNSASLSVSAISSTPVNFQWVKDSSLLTGKTDSILNVSSLSATALYFCVVKNQCDSIRSSIVTLRLNQPLSIIMPPVTQFICPGSNTSFAVKVSEPLVSNYQWILNDSDIIYADSSVLTIHNASVKDTGIYICIIGNACGFLSTDAAHLNFSVPVILNQPTDKYLCLKSDSTIQFKLNAIVPGSTPQYQWQTVDDSTWINLVNDTGSFLGVNTAELTISSIDSSFNKSIYHCIVSNTGCGLPDTTNNIKLFAVNYYIPFIQANRRLLKCAPDKVILSTADLYKHYSWSNTDTTAFIVVPDTGTFTLTVRDNNGCSGISPAFVLNDSMPIPKICLVTIDSATEKNTIVWERIPGLSIASYNILRMNLSGTFDSIGNVTAGNFSKFVDPTSTPKLQQYSYALQSVDSCGNKSLRSAFHKTLHIYYDPIDSVTYQIKWNKYETEDNSVIMDKYSVYRSTDSIHFILLSQMSPDLNTAFTDNSDSTTFMKFYYQFRAMSPGLSCVTTSFFKINEGPYSQAVSNLEDNRMKSDTSSTNMIAYPATIINATVAPNPFNEFTYLTYNLPVNSFVKTEIISAAGSICKLLFAEQQNSGSYEIPIDGKDMPAGFYMLRLTINNKCTYIKLILTN